MSFVIDASVAIKWFIEENLSAEAGAILDRGEPLFAPDLLLAEIGNVLWKKVTRGEVARGQAEVIVTALPDCFSRLWPCRELAGRALELAFALDHPAYDCFYLACAEAAGGTLITADKRLNEAAAKAGFAALVHPLGSRTHRGARNS